MNITSSTLITSGWNVLRFIKMEQTKQPKQIHGVEYIAFKFTAVNVTKHEIEFAYLVPNQQQTEVPSIIKDLIELVKNKKWMDLELVERKRVLAIRRMKEPFMPQEDIKYIEGPNIN